MTSQNDHFEKIMSFLAEMPELLEESDRLMATHVSVPNGNVSDGTGVLSKSVLDKPFTDRVRAYISAEMPMIAAA